MINDNYRECREWNGQNLKFLITRGNWYNFLQKRKRCFMEMYLWIRTHINDVASSRYWFYYKSYVGNKGWFVVVGWISSPQKDNPELKIQRWSECAPQLKTHLLEHVLLFLIFILKWKN